MAWACFEFSPLRCEFEIPDPTLPSLDPEVAGMGPSADLIPFHPAPLKLADVAGRRNDRVSDTVGAYGMGGPGFFGLCLGDDWLVIAIWGAGDWIRVDGRLVSDPFHTTTGRSLPWIDDDRDRLSERLAGAKIATLNVCKRSMRMRFSDGLELVVDCVQGACPPNSRGWAPRTFLETDDLRRAVFLAPTEEIWV